MTTEDIAPAVRHRHSLLGPGWLTRLLKSVPSQCRVCHTWPSAVVCSDCRNRFGTPTPRCVRCATPFAGLGHPLEHDRECGTCLRHPPALARCIAAVHYAYPWDQLIGRFKFGDEPALATALGQLWTKHPSVQELVRVCDALIPMPLSKQRLHSRGYNQASLLAHQLDPCKTRNNVLLRIRDTRAQSECSVGERLLNVRHAFAVNPTQRHCIRDQHLLLTDDVMTTGASLYEAAETLLRAGASKVSAVVLARTHNG